MKSKKSAPAPFEALSRDYMARIACAKQADEAQAKKDQLSQHVEKTRREHMFKWLIEQATNNFQRQLSSDNPCLLNHFIALFKDRAHPVTDTTGVSGFPLPPSKMRFVPLTKKERKALPGFESDARKIINFNDRPSVSVHVLIIYRGPQDEDSSKRLPDIALVIKTDGQSRSDITAKHFANCRVALIEWCDMGNPVSPDTNFHDNQDYILKLVELSTPETMFEQIFKHHGPAKID